MAGDVARAPDVIVVTRICDDIAKEHVFCPIFPSLVVRAFLQKRVDKVVATFTVIGAFLAILDCR